MAKYCGNCWWVFCEFGGEVGGGSIIRGCSWGFDESIGRRER